MTWDELDWPALDRLRDRFLRGSAATGAYWQSAADLASYDFTYAERIGWKWDHVLRELHLRGWQPRSRRLLDWGCGSGIAHRRVIASFGRDRFDELLLWDHSPLATEFAAEAAAQAFPGLAVSAVTPGFLLGDEPVGLLVISHVLNELAPADLDTLRAVIARADAVLWVEPGTHEVSRHLGQLRDSLLADLQVVAPCTHALTCPMFTPGRERDWCHFFAPPPLGIQADSNWVKFGQRAGIDLRSLPYAFIALERVPGSPATLAGDAASAAAFARHRGSEDNLARDPGGAGVPLASAGLPAGDPQANPLSRVIGRPEHFKPYARLLNCDASGLADLELPKRADPALFKQLERTKAPLIYRWTREGDKITGGQPLV